MRKFEKNKNIVSTFVKCIKRCAIRKHGEHFEFLATLRIYDQTTEIGLVRVPYAANYTVYTRLLGQFSQTPIENVLLGGENKHD